MRDRISGVLIESTQEREEEDGNDAAWRLWAAAWAGIAWLHGQDVYSRQSYAACQAIVDGFGRLRIQVDNLRIDVEKMRKEIRKGK